MSTNVVFNNVTYSIPAEGDSNWGTNVSNYLIAIASGTLQKSSGSFTLLAELDFGATYGLKTAYVKSRATNPAGSGIFRLGNTQAVAWRNAANTSDLSLLVDASDNLTFGGTKITISGAIVNADIAAGAAIALSKLAALTASRVLVSDGSGVIAASSVTATTLGYLDATSSIQTQLNGKEPTITNLPIAQGGTNSTTALNNNRVMQSSGGAIVEASAITAARVLISDANGIPTHSTVTTTTLGYLDATSSIQTQLNAKEATITNLPINKGGTNSTTALNNNRIMQSSGGAIVEASAITAARVLISDANGIPTHSTITSTTLGYLDATSSVQTQLNAKEPTISAGTAAQYWRGDKSWQTLDKSAVGLSNVDNTSDATKNAAAVQLTNKDYEGGTASNTSRLTVPKNTKTNLDALTRKEATLVYGSDTDKLYVDDGTNLIEVGSGGGGTVNFISNGDGSAGTTGWTTGSYTAATRPSGTFTASSGAGAFAVSTTTTTPLGTGTSSLTFTKSSGANRQGRAIEYSFALGLGYRAKVLTLGIQYIINSGTFVAGANGTDSSLIWYCAFSTDNGSTYTVAEPSTFKLFSNSSTISADYRANIQTPYNATNMKLIAYVAETATTAWEVEAVVNVSPSQYVYGTPITDWQDFPSVAAGTLITAVTTNPTYGTIAVNKAQWRRVGQNAEMVWSYRQTTAGTAGSGMYLFNIPASIGTIDTAKAPANTGTTVATADSIVGSLTFGTTSTVFAATSDVSVYSTTQLKAVNLMLVATVSGYNAAPWGTFAASQFNQSAGQNYTLRASVPILGWSSSVQMSDNAAQNIVCCSYNKSATQAVTASVTNITFPNKTFDSTGSFDGTTFTAPVAGYYSITGAYIYATTATGFSVFAYVNATVNIALGSNNSNGGDSAALSGVLYLNAGDALTIRVNATITIGNNGYLQIHRLAGPNSIGATETVSCRYTTAAGQSIPNTGAVVDFGTKVWDNTGSVSGTGTSWKFTAPIAGEYQVNAAVLYTTATFTLSTGVSLQLMKNGSVTEYSVMAVVYPQATASTLLGVNGASTIKLLAGDYIQVLTDHGETTNRALYAGASYNWVEIKKIGNY